MRKDSHEHWLEFKADPVRYGEHKRKARERYWRVKADPEAYAALLARRRAYYATHAEDFMRRQREYLGRKLAADPDYMNRLRARSRERMRRARHGQG